MGAVDGPQGLACRAPWLEGPIGKPAGIGATFFESYAAERALRAVPGPSSGLIPDLAVLRGPDFDPRAVAPAVSDFYARTSAYDLDAWSQWSGRFGHSDGHSPSSSAGGFNS